MQMLTGTVGEGGGNAVHDTTLVQAILVSATRPREVDAAQRRYLERIDGVCGERTVRAIREFQNDRVPGGTPGRVAPGDTTWTRMVAALPDGFVRLRALPDSKVAYLAATTEARDAALARVAQSTFESVFRTSVTALLNQIFERHGIAIGVCHNGDRRTFATQYELLVSGRNVTKAGPGESNHNYGQAVDLGFAGLRWIRPDGSVVANEDAWLHQLDPDQTASGEALRFWDVIRTNGVELGLFRGPESDRPHLQAWSDGSTSMGDRLGAHLTRSGRMRWTGRRDQGRNRYQCDLGFGGRFFDVGTAADVWGRRATVTAETIAEARAQGVPAGAAGVRAGALPALPPVTEADVAAMREALRADFEAADRNWQAWTPR